MKTKTAIVLHRNSRRITTTISMTLQSINLALILLSHEEHNITIFDIPHEKTGVDTRQKEMDKLLHYSGEIRMILKKWLEEYNADF